MNQNPNQIAWATGEDGLPMMDNQNYTQIAKLWMNKTTKLWMNPRFIYGPYLKA
jgi:hypothetical protein